MFRGKQLRAFTLTFFLFAGVLIFHHLGGGTVNFSPLIFPILIGSVIYFRIRPIEFFSGPDLALAIVIFQALGHFTISTESHQNSAAMALSHLIASFITYQLAKHFDIAADSCDRLIQFLFPKLPIKVSFKAQTQRLLFSLSETEFVTDFVRDGLKERAPPIFSCA
jgi:hypothetical protein